MDRKRSEGGKVEKNKVKEVKMHDKSQKERGGELEKKEKDGNVNEEDKRG